MGDTFSDLRKASREREHKPETVERKRGGDVPPDRTFSSGSAALSNARNLQAKGEISKSELRGVERSVRSSPLPAKREATPVGARSRLKP